MDDGAAGDFIEVHDGALDPEACRALVERFEASRDQRRGETGGGLDTTLKDSWDIPIDPLPAWEDAKRRLNDVALIGFKRYLRRYPHAALAPLRTQIQPPDGSAPVTLDAERFATLDDATLNAIVLKAFRPGTINLQKYLADVGGYPYWHSELYPKLDYGESLHRVVLWTLYLNDDFGAGETEFLYQRRKVAPRTGSLLIAPASYTHTHRGNVPRGGPKYIATSWILFQRAETLFGDPGR